MSVVDEIKSRLDVVDVVSDYVQLQKAGRNLKALCPFHTEKTPSFVVTPERQTWRCFGACSTGGDIISFVMRKEALEYGEALRLLAQKAGVELHQRRDGSRDDRLYRVNREAGRFFEEALASPEGNEAMAYLAERGVDSNAISSFQLGLSPGTRGALTAHLGGLGFNIDEAIEAGLIRRSDDGSLWDFFRGRLMFPIHDRRGRLAGFGARSLDGSDPKYLNTSATPVFDKRATLYGLHMAVAPIREQDTAVVVEGYMDAIAAHQHGYTNVVASMGTALTEEQVYRLRSLAKNFVLALDPDVAGQEATLRSLESSWRVFERQAVGGRQRSLVPLYQSEQTSLRIAALPTGVDPDALIRQDAKEWARLVRDATPYRDYVIEAVASRYDLGTPQGKAQAAEVLAPLVAGAGTAIEQEHYFRKVADVLDVSKETLEASIGRPRAPVSPKTRKVPAGDAPRAASVSAFSESRQDFLEDYVLALLLDRPELREHAETVAPELFHRTENREVFTSWLGSSTIDELRASLDQTLGEHLEYLSQVTLEPTDRRSHETALSQSLRRLEQRHLQEMQEGLLATEDATTPPPRELEEAIVSVNTRLKELFSQRG